MQKPITKAPGPGFSIFAAAREIPMPHKRLIRAVEAGEVAVVWFGKTKRITETEIQRIRKIYGLPDRPLGETAPLEAAE